MHQLRLISLIFFLSLGLPGCFSSVFGAEVKTAKTVAEKPSDVTVYVTVEDGGEPVGYLETRHFEIYENDVLLDPKEVHLQLLSRNQAARGHTVLLIDLSGEPETRELRSIAKGAAQFVEKVTVTQPVTVVAFDGSARAREVARFEKVAQAVKRPLPPLAPFLSRDTSRDLNGAVLAAIKGLRTQLKGDDSGMQFGTVATLSRGPDLAGRKDDKTLQTAIRESGFEFYAISPTETKFNTLSDIGRNKRFTYESLDTLPLRFQDLGMRVRDAWKSHYLVSYCSPARAGTRKLKVRAVFSNDTGSKRSGSSKSEFDATGFAPGCVPAEAGPSITLSAEMKAAADEETREANSKKSKGRPQKVTTIGAKPKASKKSPSQDFNEEEDDGEVIAPPSSSNYE